MRLDAEKSRLVLDRLARLLGKLSAQPEPRTVHWYRTTTRRVESLAELLALDQRPAPRKLLKSLARVRRRAGRVRDMDVQIAALRTLKIGRNHNRKQELMDALLALRSRRERKLRKTLDQDTVRDTRRRLRRWAASDGFVPSDRVQPLRVALGIFADVARRNPNLNEQTLHQYRIRCKHIRYMAELSSDPAAPAVVAQLRRLQDAIGEWHDWDSLALTAEKVFAPQSECPLLAAIRNLAKARCGDALRIAAEVRGEMLHTYQVLRRTPGKRAAAASGRAGAAVA